MDLVNHNNNKNNNTEPSKKQEATTSRNKGKRAPNPCNQGLSKDRHVKVNGRDRRVRLSKSTAPLISSLTRDLGHKYDGETIAWLLKKAEVAVNAAMADNVNNNNNDNNTIVGDANVYAPNENVNNNNRNHDFSSVFASTSGSSSGDVGGGGHELGPPETVYIPTAGDMMMTPGNQDFISSNVGVNTTSPPRPPPQQQQPQPEPQPQLLYDPEGDMDFLRLFFDSDDNTAN